MMVSTKFLLLLGPSGVGKSTIIRGLRLLDNRFSYIAPYTTRRLRPGESDKIPVSDVDFDILERRGMFLTVNHLYGVRYGTPREPIEAAFRNNLFPVLDWPLNQLQVMEENYPGRILPVYLTPPSIDALQQRLSDGRDPSAARLTAGVSELLSVSQAPHSIRYKVINYDGMADATVQEVYRIYMSSL